MIVSLSGKPGSGKSTVAKKLASALGYERVYIGGIRREAARKRGMTLAEFNTWSETHSEGDTEFDKQLEHIGKTKDNIIIEGRTAFHFIPHSLKVFLDISTEEGAKRIWKSIKSTDAVTRNEGNKLTSYEAVLKNVKQRIKSDSIRYQKYYKLDIFDTSHYDLFLDTTRLNPDEEYQRVHDFIQSRLAK